MLLHYHSWMFYNYFIATLCHFLGLTCLHSAQYQLLFFASQKINTKRSPNAAKLFGEFFWAKRHGMGQRNTRGVPPRGCTTHLGVSGGPGAPWWVVPPSGHPPGASPAHWMSSGPKTSTRSFAAFGLCLVLISYDVKNMKKIALGTMSIG